MSDAAPASATDAVAAAPPPGGVRAAVRTQRLHALRRLRAVFVLALLLPAIGYVAVAAYLYDQEFDDARLRLDRAVRIAQEHALKLFETNQMLLQRMLDMVGERSDEDLLAHSVDVHARLRRMAEDLPQVQGLFVIGADGRALGLSRVFPPPRQIDYSDREWYRAHRSGRGPEVFVTEQIESRATGEKFFDMSRRRSRRDGSFAGTVHVSLRPEYLTRFYAELATAEPDLHMAVLRQDGRILARWPQGPLVPAIAPEHPLMKHFATGAAAGEDDGASPFDGVDRLRAFRRLDPYPLYAVAAIDTAAVVAAWRSRIVLLALFVFPTALGFAWMARLALLRTQQEFESAQRLEDETARRQRVEMALLQSQKLEAMGRLTGGVAHDFNNVLTVVSSNLFLLRRLHGELAQSPQLAAIDRAIDSGTKLTRQLLAFSRRQALRPERVQLQERLPPLADMLRPVLGAGITISCRVAADTAPITVDPAELELALINLAVNAKDAMAEGGRFEIEARNAAPGELGAPGQAFVLIEATDTGAGIAPDDAARAFEPFFTTKALGRGTGLGLSQVQALCHSAGGDASIAPRPGGGGTRVRLFLRASDAQAGEGTAVPAAAIPSDLRCKVLLAEDNDAVAQATTEVLRSLGCTVERVASGEAAVDFVQRRAGEVELVLTDIEMPGETDGIGLAAHLQRNHPHLPVVLMTGYAERLEQAVRQRFEVLPKPCSPAVLAASVARALGRYGAAERSGAVG